MREITIVGYSMHGRSADGLADYGAVFSSLAGLSPITSQFTIGSELVAVASSEVAGDGVYRFRYVAGHPDSEALLFDPVTGDLDEVDFEQRFIARSAWLVVDATRRVASLEVRRPGVAPSAISSHLEKVMEEVVGLRSPTFDLNPIPSKSILDELDRLERIREARVVLARPNFDWNENADQLSEMGDESNARQVEVGARAPRGGSLSPRDGIVGAIRSLLGNAVGPIKDFRVKGTRPGESKERTISLENNSERRFVPIEPGESESTQVKSAGTQLVAELEPGEEAHPDEA